MKKQVVKNERTSETAATIAAPLIEFLRYAPDDEVAKSVILLVRAVAREENAEARRLFANDVGEKIFAGTFAARDAALQFAQ